MTHSGPTRILHVEPSSIIRRIVADVLTEAGDLLPVGGAADAFQARAQIVLHHPDVIVLDSELPRVGGLDLLKKLKEYYPVPVVMTVPQAAYALARQAERLGAADVLVKPAGRQADIRRFARTLVQRIRLAVTPGGAGRSSGALRVGGQDNCDSVIVVIGASTGGTEALREFLDQAPANFPPVAVVQHLPAAFTKSFAERLDRSSAMTVTEAADQQVLKRGDAVVARGDTHMVVEPAGPAWRVCYTHQRPINRHCPSVEPLFDSAAVHAGRSGVGVLLTGMGADGAAALLRMRQAGALTVTQSQETCVVWGMPKVAVELGASQLSGAPAELPGLILAALRSRRREGVLK